MRPAVYLVTLVTFSLSTASAAAQVPDKYKPAIKKGLDWLTKQQNADGSWTSQGQYPVAMTSFAGLALLMEGSTTCKGDHAERLRKACDWLVKRTGDNGMIGDPKNPSESGRYIFGQGFGMLFLASAYAEEENRERRLQMKDALHRAVRYAVAAQSTKGGWYYTSCQDGHDNDEGATSICQLQGLCAARAAGIPVPKAALTKAFDYLKQSTSPQGAIYYALRSKTERPALTAAAIAGAYGLGQYNSDHLKKWIKYAQKTLPFANVSRFDVNDYTQFYLAQAVYGLGEKGYGRLFPDERDGWQWSKYRETVFDHLLKSQGADGSWGTSGGLTAGPFYASAIYLMVLQMDNEAVPFLGARSE